MLIRHGILALGFVCVLLATATTSSIAQVECPSPGDTIESLHHCVTHAVSEGHVTDPGLATSLLAKLDAAQAALDRGEIEAALGALQAFINEVSAQAGIGIDAEHAEHMIAHAERVIAAIE